MKILEEKIELFKCNNCGHIQKNSNNKYLIDTILNIYNNYSLYYLSDGHEQPKFYEEGNLTKSELVINNTKNLFHKKDSLLDYGCGNGAFLKKISKTNHNLKLYGLDLSLSNKNEILQIDNVHDFFLKNIPLKSNFSIISLIHCLEHILNPYLLLKELSNHLANNGVILIQVPNFETNLFDAIIYDHISHFTPSSLYYLLKQKFKYVVYPKKQISKEITMIASHNPILDIDHTTFTNPSLFESKKLDQLEKNINTISINYQKIAIFGAAIEGLYLSQILNTQLSYIIDEDENKIGKKLNGISIVSPANFINTSNDIVILPFNKEISKKIKNKFQSIKFIELNETSLKLI